jgi:hypothetical protein
MYVQISVFKIKKKLPYRLKSPLCFGSESCKFAGYLVPELEVYIRIKGMLL